jgi:hypothetical protein
LITLTPDDMKQRFGPLFVKKFLIMADEHAVSQIEKRGIEVVGLCGDF